jgi:hypothetical protein
MSERAEFLKWVDSELRDAEVAIHNGDGDPRRAIWSTQDPVILFGAWKSATTAAGAEEVFHRLEQDFSDCTSYSMRSSRPTRSAISHTRSATSTRRSA